MNSGRRSEIRMMQADRDLRLQFLSRQPSGMNSLNIRPDVVFENFVSPVYPLAPLPSVCRLNLLVATIKCDAPASSDGDVIRSVANVFRITDARFFSYRTTVFRSQGVHTCSF